MTVFFTKRSSLDESILIDGQPLLIDGRPYALPERAKELLLNVRNVPDQMPFALGPNGTYDRLVSEFLLGIEAEGCISPRTWRSYAYDLESFRKFLAEREEDHSLIDADREDFDAFYRIRVHGTSERQAVSYATWSRQAAALRRFYEWLSHKTNRPSKFPAGRFKGRRSRQAWRTASLPVNGGTVKCVSMQDFDTFVNLGLKAVANDPSANARNRTVLRNVAFAELLVTTGMRLSEATALLKHELPANEGTHPGGSGQRMLIASATAKGAKSRLVYVPTRVLDEQLRDYLDFVRSNVCASDRALSRYASQRQELRTARQFGPTQCVDARTGQKIEYAKLNLSMRQRLFCVQEPGDTLEPAMLWLAENGSPVSATAFSAAFTRANLWLQREHGINLGITPHTLRHTYAVYMLSLLIRTAVGGADELRRERATCGSRAYRQLIADPLRNLQLLLGHSSQETTSVYLTYVDQRDESLHAALATWNSRSWDYPSFDGAAGSFREY